MYHQKIIPALLLSLAVAIPAPALAEDPVPVPTVENGTTTEQTAAPDGHFTQENSNIYTVSDILLVNKQHALPADYTPLPGEGNTISLLPAAQAAYDVMQKDAAAAGVGFYICSAYRSYNHQANLFYNYSAQFGEARASTFSARAGMSEHQTGLAMDICAAGYGGTDLQPSMANTPAGKWLAENSWKYGFILRYPQGKEHITGYQFEPWHYRYVGQDAAREIGPNPTITLEEYLGEGATITDGQIPARIIAHPNTALIQVDQQPVALSSYNINDHTYYRLRDLASAFRDTGSRFDVGWDNALASVTIETDTAYTSTTAATPAKNSLRTALHSSHKLYLKEKDVTPLTFNIDGSNYYKLRDLAPLLSFDVGYEESTRTITIHTKEITTPDSIDPHVVDVKSYFNPKGLLEQGVPSATLPTNNQQKTSLPTVG